MSNGEMDNVIKEFPMIHDNRVLRYQVDLIEHVLTLELLTETEQLVTVQFSGLMAHRFEHVGQDNILFGMEEVTSAYFFACYRQLLERTLPYGFPVCGGPGQLKDDMQEQKIRIFVLTSSLGLCGFVLARDVALTAT